MVKDIPCRDTQTVDLLDSKLHIVGASNAIDRIFRPHRVYKLGRVYFAVG